ncbi:MAG TPA: hypothetical protein VGQ59_00985 [Cyclobacteriaceae bacterium]|jgi:hypothetical protein|nr:hypothetical protein [Cyclobacteriaceae bacterium]
MNRNIEWELLSKDLIENCEIYHRCYYDKKTFSGPSLHFHKRALNASQSEKAEMVYALLVSWGMHRMGGGPQMNDFDIFSDSLADNFTAIQALSAKNIDDIDEDEFNLLEKVFIDLKLMKSSKKIVANSKILAHYLPNIIAPIDNEYTFRFIFGAARSPGYWKEFELFREIHLNLVKQVIVDKRFKDSADKWLNNRMFPWDTSLPKIVDNLIIGKIGEQKRLQKRAKKH